MCGNNNQTFTSLCDLYRERCLCKKKDAGCSKAANAKVWSLILGLYSLYSGQELDSQSSITSHRATTVSSSGPPRVPRRVQAAERVHRRAHVSVPRPHVRLALPGPSFSPSSTRANFRFRPSLKSRLLQVMKELKSRRELHKLEWEELLDEAETDDEKKWAHLTAPEFRFRFSDPKTRL